jgi:hypothetical protein
MSWPGTDFEVEIQNELDELRAFKALFAKWLAQPQDSRLAVIDELRDMANGWKKNANDEDTRADAVSLGLVVEILEKNT